MGYVCVLGGVRVCAYGDGPSPGAPDDMTAGHDCSVPPLRSLCAAHDSNGGGGGGGDEEDVRGCSGGGDDDDGRGGSDDVVEDEVGAGMRSRAVCRWR